MADFRKQFGPAHHTIETLFAGEVLCDIGQVPEHVERLLARLIRSGFAVKWRGKWYPHAGAAWGLGPDKTCYGLAAKFAKASA